MTKQVNISEELYSLIEHIRKQLEVELGINITFSQASKTLYFRIVNKDVSITPKATDKVTSGYNLNKKKVYKLDFKDLSIFG